MAALRNPYLSNNTQNLLLKKNFNVIKSPQKSALYPPSYTQNLPKNTHEFTKINNHESSTSIGNKSSSVSLQNPFSSKTLGERNQNFPQYHANTPSFYTHAYLPSVQKNQLPFPSYNRPQTNRGTSFSSNKMSKILSLSRRNLAVSNIGITETSSLQKNMTGPYRPYFVSPKHNNDWNTEKWKTELQKKERNNLKQFGPQALRYESKTDKNFNNEYYSMSNINAEPFNYRIIKAEKTQPQTRVKKIVSFDDNLEESLPHQHTRHNHNHNLNNTHQSSSSNSLSVPRDPDTYHQQKKRINVKNFSDIRQQSEVHVQNQNSESLMEEYQSFVKENDENQNQFMWKYDEKIEKKNRKGPLDLDVFDSGYDNDLMEDSKQKDLDMNSYGSGTFGNPQKTKFKQEESSVFRTNQVESKGFQSYARYNKESHLRESVQNIQQKDFPQRLEYKNRFYYRIKLIQEKK